MIEVIITKKPWSKPKEKTMAMYDSEEDEYFDESGVSLWAAERSRKTQKKKTKIDTTREEKIITRKEYNTKKNQLSRTKMSPNV